MSRFTVRPHRMMGRISKDYQLLEDGAVIAHVDAFANAAYLASMLNQVTDEQRLKAMITMETVTIKEETHD